MDLYKVSGIISIYALFISSSTGKAEGQYEQCSARQQSEVHLSCNDVCQSTSDCMSPRECVCDGVCGLSCVNTVTENNCPSIAPPTSSQLIALDMSFGGIARYLCIPGYKLLSGDLIRKCRGDGTWSGLPPNCAIPDCPIKEAEITNTGRLCRQTCNDDSECIANIERCFCDDICGFTCIPNFQAEFCELIPVNNHVQTTYDRPSRIFGTVATSECEVGYTHQSSNPIRSRTCEGDRTWSGEDLICTKILSCPDPPKVPDAEIDESYESDLYVPGDLVYYRCNYQNRYAYNIECQEDETWTETDIDCREPCIILSDIDNGEVSYSHSQTVVHDTEATYTCDDGYRISRASSTDRCQLGQWANSQAPTCTPAPCNKFEDWQGTVNYSINTANTEVPHRTNATFSDCGNGFRLSQNNRVLVCHLGDWHGETVCIPTPCDILHIQRGTIEYNPPLSPSDDEVPSGTQATYQCNEGLQIEEPGTGIRRCERGRWTSLVPRCVEKPCAKILKEPDDHWSITYSPTFSSNQASVSHEVVATLRCDNGYRGDVIFKTCNRGSWNTDVLPVCNPDPCDPITPGNHVADVDYNRVPLGDQYSDGTQATIVCDQQTAIVDEGDGSVWCSAGVWEPSIPLCGTHNIALRKPAYQSSTALNSPAGRAVDGDTITTTAGNSCTHTANNDDEPWWYVDLGDQYSINRINIVNYNDAGSCPSCKRRLQGAVVRVSGSWNPSTLSDYTQCGNTVTRDQANSGQPIEFNCNQPNRGRYISVQLFRSGTGAILQLCEVQVYGSGPIQGCIVPAIPNGYVTNSQQSVRYSPDEIVTSQQGYMYYKCDSGYTRQGPLRYNICREDRDWAFQHSTCE